MAQSNRRVDMHRAIRHSAIRHSLLPATGLHQQCHQPLAHVVLIVGVTVRILIPIVLATISRSLSRLDAAGSRSGSATAALRSSDVGLGGAEQIDEVHLAAGERVTHDRASGVALRPVASIDDAVEAAWIRSVGGRAVVAQAVDVVLVGDDAGTARPGRHVTLRPRRRTTPRLVDR